MSEALVKISDDEKLKTAEKYKNEGNELFRNKDIKKAIGKYHRAVLQLKGVGKDANVGALFGVSDSENSKISPENQETFDKLKIDCFNNLSACLLQEEQPNYKKILEYTEEVLHVSPDNVKAHHRRGVAFYHLKKYEESISHLKRANEKDASTKKYLLLCKKAIEKEDKELRDTYKSMFRSTKNPTESQTNVINGYPDHKNPDAN